MNMRDVAHEHRLARHLFDRELVDRGDRVRAGVHRQRVILGADLDVAGGQDDVLLFDRRGDVGGRQAARVERLLVEIDHDDARLAAVGIGNFRAVHDRQIGADGVLALIVQLGVRQPAAGEAELNDRDVSRAIAQNQRRRDVPRHVFQDDQRAARQLRNGARDVGAFVKIDLLDADAGIARRLDPADVIDQRGELALVQRENAIANVRRAHPAVGPHDADHRDVDFRKDIDRHAQRRADAHDADENERGDDGVRSLQRKRGQTHRNASGSRTAAANPARRAHLYTRRRAVSALDGRAPTRPASVGGARTMASPATNDN